LLGNGSVNTCCLCGPCRGVIRKKTGATESVGREQLYRDDLSGEVEESTMLKAVTRERLVKTQQARKDLVCAVVIWKVWRFSMAL
jgi:hypothetical protein